MSLTEKESLDLIAPLVDEHCRINVEGVGDDHHVRIDRKNPAGVTHALPAHLRPVSGEDDEFCSFSIGLKEQALQPGDLVDYVRKCIPDSWEAHVRAV